MLYRTQITASTTQTSSHKMNFCSGLRMQHFIKTRQHRLSDVTALRAAGRQASTCCHHTSALSMISLDNLSASPIFYVFVRIYCGMTLGSALFHLGYVVQNMHTLQCESKKVASPQKKIFFRYFHSGEPV